MAEALGDKQVMFLRNHGVIACGKTVAHAFENLYLLEMACRAQVTAQGTGAALLLQSREMMEKVTHQKATHPAEDNSGVLWEAMRRWMRDIDPSFEN
jgi:ribulose-5-phosphate 4-epimerase/fuculose-1-phosphate aldolase